MPTVKTIDQRIRERAAQELAQELKQLAAPLRDRMRGPDCNGYAMQVIPAGEDGPATRQYGQTIIDKLVERIYASELESRQERAVSEFMGRVENLQSQLDEVRDLAGV
jgi:hypothetical protein